jgi:hypothetical protein
MHDKGEQKEEEEEEEVDFLYDVPFSKFFSSRPRAKSWSHWIDSLSIYNLSTMFHIYIYIYIYLSASLENTTCGWTFHL